MRPGILAAMLLVSACGGGTPAGPTPAAPAPPVISVASIAIRGEALAIGAAAQFTAIATLSNNTTQDVSSQAEWRSSNQAAATVASGGMVRGLASGQSDISATYQGVSGSYRVDVAVRTFTLSGVATDATSGQPLAAVQVEAIDGESAGALSVAGDAPGSYVLRGLRAGAFTARARSLGYDSGDQRITIDAADVRADYQLRRSAAPDASCAYAAALTSGGAEADPAGVLSGVSITRTAGTCTWEAASDASWITFFAAASGSGNAVLQYVVAQNLTGSPRSGRITVTWATGRAQLTVTQAAGCSYVPDAQSIEVAATSGGSYSLALHRGYGSCAWQAIAASWIQLAAASGEGNDAVRFSVQTNPQNAVREGGIVLRWPGADGFLTITVRQAALAPEVCWYTAAPQALRISPTTALTQIAVTRTSGSCSWQASVNSSWLIVGNSAGTGTGTIALLVQPNTSASARTATVIVQWNGGSAAVAVTQDGDIPCTYSVSPGEIRISLGGLPPEPFVVTASRAGCAWTASTSASWLFLSTSPLGHTVAGNGSGIIGLAANAVTTRDCIRAAVVEVRWSGGGADVVVYQPGWSGPQPPLCPSP
jgi:hypothetical protein